LRSRGPDGVDLAFVSSPSRHVGGVQGLLGSVHTVRVLSLLMDLRELRYFVAVAEELHFGRAAARLHMTQPPLSRAIKQLETDLGCSLLRHSASGVTLTAAGASLYDEARTLLAQADQVRARVTAAAGEAAITIGTLADSVAQVGTQLASAYRERHPGIHVRIREGGPDRPDHRTARRPGRRGAHPVTVRRHRHRHPRAAH
jgi:DNA-binding transcriptional LysR family regulator